jgi:hypothetical protein
MKGQRLQIAQALLKLAPNITANDRSLCAKKLKISKVTICYYLKGKVSNNDKGLELIAFFKECIAARQKEIQELCK